MFIQILRYTWALPATAIGLLFVPLAWLSGGKVAIVQGVVEIQGGLVRSALRRVPLFGAAAAMTLGHVILGQDRSCLDRSREHEHVHVRQYERWGPLFLPLYLGSSLWLYLRGFNPYLDNPFEREAYEKHP